MEGKRRDAVFCAVKCRTASYLHFNAEIIAEQKRKYRQENPENVADYNLQYRQENREQISRYRRKYLQENHEKVAEQQRKYRQENPEKVAEWKREYYNNILAAASTLRLAHTISQLKGTTNGTHEPE